MESKLLWQSCKIWQQNAPSLSSSRWWPSAPRYSLTQPLSVSILRNISFWQFSYNQIKIWLNCPASARIISSFDFKHRTSYDNPFSFLTLVWYMCQGERFSSYKLRQKSWGCLGQKNFFTKSHETKTIENGNGISNWATQAGIWGFELGLEKKTIYWEMGLGPPLDDPLIRQAPVTLIHSGKQRVGKGGNKNR